MLTWLKMRGTQGGKQFTTKDSLQLLGAYIGISIAAYFIPVLANSLGKAWVTTISPVVVGSIVLFAPLWVLYWGFVGGEPAIGKGLSTLFSIYIIVWFIWVLLSVLPVVQHLSGPFNAESSAVVSPKEALLGAWTTLKTNYDKITNATIEGTKKQLNVATGDAFTGKVDNQAKEKLGIVMGDIKLTQQKFSTQDTVGVYAAITGEALDAPLKLKVSCTSETAKKTPAVTPDPSKEIDLGAQESIDVDCSYPPDSFATGTASITLGATFSTESLAYLKTYLMEKERLRDLRDNKIDPFQQYGITDRNPVTIYTSGPVNIGMGFGTPPLGINLEEDEFVSTLGITLSNAWAGKIDAIERVVVVVPRGFTITELTGEGTIKPLSCLELSPLKDWCDDEVSTAYIITPVLTSAIAANNAYTVRARLRAHQPDYPLLLGNTPLSTRYFKAAASYTYTLEKSTNINILAADAGGSTSECGTAMLAEAPKFTLLSTETTINVKTTAKTAAEIKYCIGADVASCASQTVSSPNAAIEHSFHLDGLTPNARYAYQINRLCGGQRTQLDGTDISGKGTFTTPATS
ncbi:hypothetical protein HY492_01715 [Candidatus Woesearchaeota archaeon]|nr:hypothetical protein [Candidatus Woesearchaeota archaeon]